MPTEQIDDEDMIITDLLPPSEPKPLTAAKLEQLASAREKALESRRRSQKAALESRLHQVRLLLGELDSAYIDKVQEAMMAQERELRRKQSDLTTKLIKLITDESAKRVIEHDSLKRSISKLKIELQEMRPSKSLCTIHEAEGSNRSDRSTVSSASSSTKVRIPLRHLSGPLPQAQPTTSRPLI